ncbi:MAG: ABC transporter permease subunit [Nanoarchaeota archaeon]|nr:ABC transporter permease subunit [Nanoarchaeota archaeon]
MKLFKWLLGCLSASLVFVFIENSAGTGSHFLKIGSDLFQFSSEANLIINVIILTLFIFMGVYLIVNIKTPFDPDRRFIPLIWVMAFGIGYFAILSSIDVSDEPIETLLRGLKLGILLSSATLVAGLVSIKYFWTKFHVGFFSLINITISVYAWTNLTEFCSSIGLLLLFCLITQVLVNLFMVLLFKTSFPLFKKFLRVLAKPGKFAKITLPLLPFILATFFYIQASIARHEENPDDKLIPSVEQIVDASKRVAFEKDRDGEIRLWEDSLVSLQRFVISSGIVFLSLFVGLFMGSFPYIDKVFGGYMALFDKIPPMALLPILFIAFGLDETAKIMLIVLGTSTTLILDTRLRAKGVPQESIIKAMTLKASNPELIFKIILPRIFPMVLDTFRLSIKSIVTFLIVGEALSATAGLGYRIFLAKRYMDMPLILVYVGWLCLAAFLLDFLIQMWIKKRYKWLNK